MRKCGTQGRVIPFLRPQLNAWSVRQHESSVFNVRQSFVKETSTKKVLEWLQKEGFPLEVRVGKALRSRDWLTYHSFSYEDPTEGKLRECDVFAHRFKRARGGAVAAIDLVIECKRSADKPWVVFADPVKEHAWFLPQTLAPGRISKLALTWLVNTPEALEYLRPQKWVGYTVVKGYTTPKDGDPGSAYSALRGVFSAAEALALRVEREFDEEPDSPSSVSITLPVVVAGAPLYLYTLDENNDEHVRDIAFAKVVAPQRKFESRCLVTVVAESAFGAWLDDLILWADPVLEKMADMAAAMPSMLANDRRAEEVVRQAKFNARWKSAER
jgi:hypothetical protein